MNSQFIKNTDRSDQKHVPGLFFVHFLDTNGLTLKQAFIIVQMNSSKFQFTVFISQVFLNFCILKLVHCWVIHWSKCCCDYSIMLNVIRCLFDSKCWTRWCFSWICFCVLFFGWLARYIAKLFSSHKRSIFDNTTQQFITKSWADNSNQCMETTHASRFYI